MDIREFLEARLAQVEARARLALEAVEPANRYAQSWEVVAQQLVACCDTVPRIGRAHQHLHHNADPARTLRDVEADRRLIALALSRQADRDLEYGRDEPLPVDRITELRILASRWSEHPDFDPPWSLS